MKKKQFICALFAVIFALSGCGLYKVGTVDAGTLPLKKGVYPSTFAHSFVGDADVYVPSELQKQMDEFGKSQHILPLEAVSVVYTDIPEQENGAKGVDPLSIVMPELDRSKYSTAYIWHDDTTGLEIHGYYRLIAGVLTDELIKVYVDTSGNIVQYETVNLGRYDSLENGEMQVESMRNALQGQVRLISDYWLRERYAPVNHPADSAYILFTDTQGRIVLCTRAALNTDRETRQMVTDVDLYAIIDP